MEVGDKEVQRDLVKCCCGAECNESLGLGGADWDGKGSKTGDDGELLRKQRIWQREGGAGEGLEVIHGFNNPRVE